jgi:hypothetical protein
VAVYNNVKRKDAEVLSRFGERAWNNPVVRFLDVRGDDLITRKGGVYSLAGLLGRMTAALVAAGREVPGWLRLVDFEHNPAEKETACFAMYCYWTGEKLLGALDGVLATRIGMHGRFEVVEVDFDPTVLPFEKLVRTALTLKCAGRVFARSDSQLDVARIIVGDAAVRSDLPVDTSTTQQKHLSSRLSYWYLPLTALQATKVNSALASKEDPAPLLSPGQASLREEVLRVLKEDIGFFEGFKPDRSKGGIEGYFEALKKRLGEADSEY